MKILLMGFAMTLTFLSTNAQINFTGKWIFESQESISGNLYSNGSPKQITVKQSVQDISLQKITAGQNGDITSNETILFDGNPSVSKTTSGRPKKSKIQWMTDKTGFIQTTEIFNATDNTKLDMKITDTWTIVDGKLSFQRKNENFTNGEVWESKAVYSKE